MTVVAVIAEYNPFHYGHAHHFKEIRKAFGEDCLILILLSGNFVQRGDVSIFDKYIRAECAIFSGADLVLELPYPYSCSSAEMYAQSAVSILNRLGCVDVLSFGSECGDLRLLSTASQQIRSRCYLDRLRHLAKENKSAGHAELCEMAYTELFGTTELLQHPNDTLAIEYLNALADSRSLIVPHTVLRSSDYHTGTGLFPSSSLIRSELTGGLTESAFARMPESSRALLLDELRAGHAPAGMATLFPHILSSLTLHPPVDPSVYADCNGGVGFRLMKACRNSFDFSSLLQKANTGKYTSARIRRALLHLFLETSEQTRQEAPAYSQLLACGKRGRALMKRIKNNGALPVLTKPADRASLPPEAARQTERSCLADCMYLWSLPVPQFALHPLRRTPYCEK